MSGWERSSAGPGSSRHSAAYQGPITQSTRYVIVMAIFLGFVWLDYNHFILNIEDRTKHSYWNKTFTNLQTYASSIHSFIPVAKLQLLAVVSERIANKKFESHMGIALVSPTSLCPVCFLVNSLKGKIFIVNLAVVHFLWSNHTYLTYVMLTFSTISNLAFTFLNGTQPWPLDPGILKYF